MSQRRSNRIRKTVDYGKLNVGIQDSDSEDEQFQYQTDVDGEWELCGSFNADEELDYEEHLVDQHLEAETDREEGEVESDSTSEDSGDEDDREVNK